MKKMNEVECKAFLTEGARTGKLATVRPNGRPHVVPIWFMLDGDQIVFTTWHESVKARNLLHNNRVALCVDNETPPFDFVMVEGTAVLGDDPDELRHWATRIAGKYMGPDLADAYGKRNSVPGELLVRVTPAKWIGNKNVAD